MRKIMAEFLEIGEKSYYVWKNKSHKRLISFIEKYFTEEDLREFLETGEIGFLEERKINENGGVISKIYLEMEQMKKKIGELERICNEIDIFAGRRTPVQTRTSPKQEQNMNERDRVKLIVEKSIELLKAGFPPEVVFANPNLFIYSTSILERMRYKGLKVKHIGDQDVEIITTKIVERREQERNVGLDEEVLKTYGLSAADFIQLAKKLNMPFYYEYEQEKGTIMADTECLETLDALKQLLVLSDNNISVLDSFISSIKKLDRFTKKELMT